MSQLEPVNPGGQTQIFGAVQFPFPEHVDESVEFLPKQIGY
jgi:hypothetical protein